MPAEQEHSATRDAKAFSRLGRLPGSGHFQLRLSGQIATHASGNLRKAVRHAVWGWSRDVSIAIIVSREDDERGDLCV